MKLTVKFAGIFAVLAFALTAVSADAAFTRSLTIGSTGPDVTELQTWLISEGSLVMPAGVNKGYFGALTQAALAKYQAKVGIVPAAGYFGPITMAKIAAAPATPGDDNDSDNGSDDLSGGEASLEQFDLSSGDDSNVEEGDSAEIAEIEFDVEDGDAAIDRIDLELTNGGSDPWDVFESATLLVDGEEIGSIDLSDEDEYLDEDLGTFRVSDIDYTAQDGDTVTIVVEVTTQNNVDDEDQGSWDIAVQDDGIRATDGEGIQQYIGDDTQIVSFDVEVAGADDELNVSSSSEDPEADTFKVEDNKKSESYAIFAFDLEAQESDVEINTVDIEVETGTTTVDVDDMVSEFTLEIDGEEFNDWSYVDADDGATTTATIQFDIDKDYTLEADSEVTVVLMAEFKAANGTNYDSGETITASIADEAIDGEGSDDIVSDGAATGEEHTVSLAGIVVPVSSIETTEDTQGDNDTTGLFTIEFSVEAFEEDFYVPEDGFTYAVQGASTTNTASGILSSTADEDTDGVFTVKEGDAETFTLNVTVSDVGTSGQYRIILNTLDSTQSSGGSTGIVTKNLDITKFRTAYKNINAN